jgi:hypothetical protein
LEFGIFLKKKQIKVDLDQKKENTKEKIMNRVDKRVFFFFTIEKGGKSRRKEGEN